MCTENSRLKSNYHIALRFHLNDFYQKYGTKMLT